MFPTPSSRRGLAVNPCSVILGQSCPFSVVSAHPSLKWGPKTPPSQRGCKDPRELRGREGPGIQMAPKKCLQNQNAFKALPVYCGQRGFHPRPSHPVPCPSSRCYRQLCLQVSLGKISYLGKGISGEISLVNYGSYSKFDTSIFYLSGKK